MHICIQLMHVYCMNDLDGSPGQASVSSFDTALGRASGDGTKGWESSRFMAG